MNLLIVGSSSEIASELEKALKRNKKIKIWTVSRKKNFKKNHITIREYTEINFNKLAKKFNKIKFDRVIFFNGYQKFSILTLFNNKLFNKIIKINCTIPLKFWSFLFKSDLLKKNSATIFVSSIASELNEVGNAYYSLAKTLLNRSIRILNEEQKKKHRFNVISLGIVKNKMSKNMIHNFPGKFKNKNSFIDINKMINGFKKIILSDTIKNSIINIHGNYKK